MAARAVPVYQVKVTLQGIRPPVWRRLLVPADLTLAKLHRVLQAAMDWGGYHLHMFTTADGENYGVPDPDDWEPVRDERRARLNQVLREPRDRLDYVYDFGDFWEHRIVLEKVVAPEPGRELPLCTAGKRACPPEDCGGVPGYYGLVDALRDPAHPRHQRYLEWLGGPSIRKRSTSRW